MSKERNILEKIKVAAARRDAIEAERAVWLSCHNESECRVKEAEWGKTDLWYLCYHILGWEFYNDPFAKYFCELVQADPDQLWLVARGHLKSLTITCAATIQYLINNPNHSVAIMSYNNATANAFLSQIKHILETNDGLKKYYSDVFYEKPESQSTTWSVQVGINVKRTTTRKEPSVFAFGLVDSQKTGMHADLLVYDDVVIQDSVGSPYMIQKTTRAWELSSNLGMMKSPTRKRYCGTRYHFYDTYDEMIKRGIRHTVIPATDDGTITGKPVYMPEDVLARMIQEQGSYTFSSQMLLKPVADGEAKFNPDDLQYYDSPDDIPEITNKYLLVDPAGKGKKNTDYTVMAVLGYDDQGDLWLVDALHDKIDLGRRWNCVQDLYEKHRISIVGYEQYGMATDAEFIDMEIKRTRCKCPPIKVLGGTASKEDRILRLVPLLEQRRLHIPRSLVKKSYFDGREYDIITALVQQLTDFPYGKHDDFIDAVSRIYDIVPVMPRRDTRSDREKFWDEYNKQNEPKRHAAFLRTAGQKIGSWLK